MPPTVPASGEPGQEKDLFRWIGPDGSSVLTYHLPPKGFEIAVNLPEERHALAQRWEGMRAMLEQRATVPVLLAMNGADHHALQPGIGHIVTQLGELAEDYEFALGSPTDYFDALPQDLDTPEVRGELRFAYRYSWMLQGGLSARTRLKQTIAEGERLLLRWAEPQAALAWIEGGPDRRPLLTAAWREQLRSCFHDTLCGTASDDVARDAASRARSVATQARGILVDALQDRLEQDCALARREPERASPSLAVINPSAHARSGTVEATLTVPLRRVVIGRPYTEGEAEPEWPAPPALVDAAGEAVPLQVLDWHRGYGRLDSPSDYPIQNEVAAFRVALEARDVPALGIRSYGVRSDGRSVEPPDHVWVSGRRVAASWGEVGEDAAGGFLLRDQESGKDVDGLATLVSERDEGDTYTFQPQADDVPVVARWGHARTIWNGPLVAAIARDFTLGARVRGTVYARLDAGSRVVRFVVEGVNLSGNHRLRIHFPLPDGTDTSRCIADGQYGPVLRERIEFDLSQYTRGWPEPTAPMHGWVSVDGGLTVFARGLSEYELTEDSIAVTLLRAVGDLSRGDLTARPGHAGWPTATPEAQELGHFRAELAVATTTAVEDAAASEFAELERLAEEFHAPLAGFMLPYGIGVPDAVPGPALLGDGLKLESVKPSEDGKSLVLRCVNVTDRRVSGSWLLPFEVDWIHRTRLDETSVQEIPVPEEGHRVAFEAGPREVVTILVEPLPLVDLD